MIEIVHCRTNTAYDMTFSHSEYRQTVSPPGSSKRIVMNQAGRVLVVEDHETERRALMQILKADGFAVFGAENADKAIGYADENIDVVLSDLHMGDISGIDLLQLWKKKKADTQFILLTGERAPVNIVEAMKSGAYDYVTKP